MKRWLSAGPTSEDTGDDDHFAFAHARLSVGAIDVLQGTHLRHHFAPHMHDFAAIGVIDGGLTRVRYRGTTSSGSNGAMVAISAGEMHTGEPGSDRGWSYRMLYPRRGLLQHALGDGLDGDESVLFRQPFIADAETRASFDDAYDALVNDGCELAAEERVLTFLQNLVRRHASWQGAEPTDDRRGGRAVRVAKDYLDARFASQVCLSDVATVADVSPFHLIRLFRREFGVPPRVYLKQLRVSRAREMLARGGELSTVAYACGFSDQSHLTRSFKSIVGVPPGAYRRAVVTGSRHH